MGTTAYGGKGSKGRAVKANRRRPLETRTMHQGHMPTHPPVS